MGNELHQDSLLIQPFHTLRLAHSHASRAIAKTQLMLEHSMGYICKKLCTKCRSKYVLVDIVPIILNISFDITNGLPLNWKYGLSVITNEYSFHVMVLPVLCCKLCSVISIEHCAHKPGVSCYVFFSSC